MSKHKKQHFIPRSYLESWCDPKTPHGQNPYIWLFSKDGENENTDKGVLPNLNVTFELGAASVLYGEKVIIFKEDGLSLPSDFSGIAYISFVKDQLSAKTMELLKELIDMGFVKITAA